MVNTELNVYIKKALASGISILEIKRNLLMNGWTEIEINEILAKIDFPNNKPVSRKNKNFYIYSFLICIILILGGSIIFLLQQHLDLSKVNSQKTKAFYSQLAQSQISFTNAGEMIFPDQNIIISEKEKYIRNKEDFVEADLRVMELILYEKGEIKEKLPILTKGKNGSWWETPTGNYKVLGKSINAYSSIGNVWMPYSLQFYGNYLLHGWPHYDDGTPVPAGYSGGCIRLANDDAKKVFNFVKVGTPILVLENHREYFFGNLDSNVITSLPPNVDAKAFLISNLASGDIILEKRANEKLPVASLTKLMTAVVAHEVIYLGRSIQTTPQMFASVSQIFSPELGDNYIGMDLLYPLLMQSSNDAAKILAGFIGENVFIKNMNIKANSLGMSDTSFADTSGLSANNISTASDLSKLLQYIFYKRPFIFDIGKGIIFNNVGLINIGRTIELKDLRNFNEFVNDPNLIGVKNGETTAAKQTLATVWNIQTTDGDVPVAIIILGSNNRANDTALLLKWLKDNFSVL